MKISKERKNLNSLQALRAMAFLGVFTHHTDVRCFNGAGAWGVSVFFILSGFLMVYSYYDKNRIAVTSFRENLVFAKNKIKGLYPLHIATMLAMAVFMFVGDKTESMIKTVVKLFLNTLLIQGWLPISERSINGVSWYLCVAVFYIFFFPGY